MFLAVAVTAHGAAAQGVTPTDPATRVLAVGRLTGKANAETMAAAMPGQMRGMVQLYLAGKIDQWFIRKDIRGAVLLLNVTTAADARSLLDALPLGQQGLMEFDLIPVGPLAPLAMLLGD
jgi:hypothetical protein